MRHHERARPLVLAVGGVLAALTALAAPPAGAQHTGAAPNGLPADGRPSTTPAALASPAPWAGVYHLTLSRGPDMSMSGRLIVDRHRGAVGGLFLIGDGVTMIDDVRAAGEELRLTLPTSAGPAVLLIRLTSTGVAGTLTVGKTRWAVVGERSA